MAKYWSFSFSISPSNEYSGLISLQSQGLSRVFPSTTVRKPQFSKPALTFFMVQLLHLYMTTGKTIALSIQTFVGKVMFLLLQKPNYKFTHRFSTAWRIGVLILALSQGQLYYTTDKQENRGFEQCYKPNRPNSTPRQQNTYSFQVYKKHSLKETIFIKQVSVNLKILNSYEVFSLTRMKLIRRKTEKFAEYMWKLLLINNIFCNPGSPAVKTSHFHCRGYGFNP